MSKYLISSKKFAGYCFLVILDAINVALMAVLLKQTLDAATSGSVKNLMSTASLILIFMIEYSMVSWGTRTIKTYYISEIMFRFKEDLFSAIVNKSRKDFEEIIVLQSGKVVEKGTFEQLMKRNGVFVKLYTATTV